MVPKERDLLLVEPASTAQQLQRAPALKRLAGATTVTLALLGVLALAAPAHQAPLAAHVQAPLHNQHRNFLVAAEAHNQSKSHHKKVIEEEDEKAHNQSKSHRKEVIEEEDKKTHNQSKSHRKKVIEEEDESLCAGRGGGCLTSKCCKDPGYQCFTKNQYWAQCMEECIPGPNPTDQESPLPWACKALGNRTPGEPKECSEPGEDCRKTHCCAQSGMQCFEKNKDWASCRPACTPGVDLTAEDSDPWTCKALGPKTPGAAPWVAKTCASDAEDCSQKQCCATPGARCYRKDTFWAQCKQSCTPGEKTQSWDKPWDCTPIGSRTPLYGHDAPVAKGRVGSWVPKRCSAAGEDCSNSTCCLEVGAQCVSKNKFWATCKTSCSKEPDPYDHNATWSCEAKGPRGWGLALKGYPSLFCITLYMPSAYEGPLLKAHLKANAGIFTCDGYDVFAAENDTLGTTKDGVEVKAILIPKIAVGRSQDGTAGNAKLFMAVWDKVIALGRFRDYDWTIKVDPDAVLLGWRIRDHMRAHVGEKVYVVNCNKFPGSPNFPMMYGAVEIFSKLAMEAYAISSWRCGKELPWGMWGEDYYMTHCMDYIGVGRIGDFGVLGDALCTGANCMDGYIGSYHPFKSIDAWMQCWGQATAKPPEK